MPIGVQKDYVLLFFFISMQLKQNVTGIMCAFILYMINSFQIFTNHFYFAVCEFMYIFWWGWASQFFGKERYDLLIFFFFNAEWPCLVCFSGRMLILFYFILPPASTLQPKWSSSGRKLVRFYIVEGMHSRGWSR